MGGIIAYQMQYLKGCFDPIPKQKLKYVSKIKQLQSLLQQVQEAAPELLELVEQLGQEARSTIKPKLTSARDLLSSFREEAVATARDTTADIKQEVDSVMQEVGDYLRSQGLDVEVVKYEPKPGEKLETTEDFVAAVERMIAQAERDGLSDGDATDDLTPQEMWELITLQDELLEDYSTRVENLEARLAAQAKLSEGANSRCTGFHEGILSALELIDKLDIISAKEHLQFTLRQAGVSDCDLAGPRGR